ncbi:tetratricopeptide repeat protein [Luteimonas saliphila]|uniref:tetratricopeptide repeat protein n=1 Tax=Luteimonas saliphila TaxID=2804919 RepID=UPI00192D730A|nr:tetratricopeptide repeat protein [Luteimonas saliphila]
MSPVLLLSIALQIGCAVHVVRTGRPLYWVFILLIGSYLAVAIYLIAEVLPEMRHHRAARNLARGVQRTLDPGRGQREASRRLDLADTIENRRTLAEQSLQAGDHARAAELYQASLNGLYATDPHLMLGLAQAQFGLNRPAEARATLEALIAANPGFRSSDGHLLYARAVEATGDIEAARHEYEALVQGYPGEEARARYALLLGREGDEAGAQRLFREILKRADALPRYYRNEQREWIDLAKRALK